LVAHAQTPHFAASLCGMVHKLGLSGIIVRLELHDQPGEK
jgi:hypothetical protein